MREGKGELRGCRGSPTPSQPDLVAETWRSALAAAFGDPRFQAVKHGDLADLQISVSVLGKLERVNSPRELDPAYYGVVVLADDGRKGLLLPGIEGIDRVDDQLHRARTKAGIELDEPVTIQRFTTRCYEEAPPAAMGDQR